MSESSDPKPSPAETTVPEVVTAAVPAPVEVRHAWWTALVPGARARAEQMARIQSGHQEVVGLVRSIRTSLEQQVDAQRRLLRSLDTLPEAVESLRHVGALTEQQREMMGVIREQLDGNAEQNKSMARSLERFSTTMSSMESTTRTLADRAESSETSLRQILEQSQRRLLLLNGLLLAAVLALGGGLAWIALSDRPAPPPAPVAPTAAAAPAPAPAATPVPEAAPPVPAEVTAAPVITPAVSSTQAVEAVKAAATPAAAAEVHPAEPHPVEPAPPAVTNALPAVAEPAPVPAPASEAAPAPAPALEPVPVPAPPAPEAPPAPLRDDPPAPAPLVAPEPAPAPPAPAAAPAANPVPDGQVAEETPTQARMREIREQMERLRREREAAEQGRSP